jgi:hypothetical protein
MKHPDGSIDELRKPPKSVGYWDDLYKPPSGLPAKLHLEELFFKKLDDRASQVFGKLENTPTLTGEETGTLAIFLLSLMHRSPAAYAAVQRVSVRMLKRIREDLRPRYAELRGPNDPPTVEEYEQAQGPDEDLRAFYRKLPGFIVNENVVNFMAAMYWRIIHRPESAKPLLISDDPLIRTNGLKKEDGHIAFPLSPDRLVVAVHKQEFLDHMDRTSTKELFVNANVQAAESARQFVGATDDSQARFIRNRFGKRPRPTLGEQILQQPL